MNADHLDISIFNFMYTCLKYFFKKLKMYKCMHFERHGLTNRRVHFTGFQKDLRFSDLKCHVVLSINLHFVSLFYTQIICRGSLRNATFGSGKKSHQPNILLMCFLDQNISLLLFFYFGYNIKTAVMKYFGPKMQQPNMSGMF